MKDNDGVDIYYDGKNVGNIDCMITFIDNPYEAKPQQMGQQPPYEQPYG